MRPSGLHPPLVGLLALLAVVSVPGCSPKKPSIENVMVISVDTLTRSSLRAFDSQATQLPVIDRFSSESVRFTNAHTPASWTLPAHASLFTGLYPDRHGTTHRDNQLLPGIPTLTMALKEAGFETVGFTDGGLVHREFGFGRGFDRYDDWVADPDSYAGVTVPRDGEPHPTRGQDMFDRAIAYLSSRRPGDRPFFLFLHTYAVHDYYRVHPWSADRVALATDGTFDYLSDCVADVNRCSEADWDLLESLYQAELLYLDDWFGRLLSTMRDGNLLDRTLIVFTSDHGEGFDVEGGRINHAGRLHEDLIRVPMLIRGPGITPRADHSFISLVDIMPTVLAICGVPLEVEMDGVDFSDGILSGSSGPANASHPNRALFAMEHTYWWEAGKLQESPAPRPRAMALSVMMGHHWYIADQMDEELYDMSTDSEQAHNTASTAADLSVLRGLAGKRSTFETAGAIRSYDADVEKQLRQLGYVE